MSTKIFISWSGSLSGQVATALKNCLEQVFQGCEPFVSSENIEKGARPSFRLLDELDTTKIGILCLTKENIERPWINFEAGYICSRDRDIPVVPVLIDLAVRDIPSYSPVHLFQMVSNQADDLKKMFIDLNKQMQPMLKTEVLSSAVSNHLPSFMDSIANAVASHSRSNKQTQAEMIAEILELCRTGARSQIPLSESFVAHGRGPTLLPDALPLELFHLFPRVIREDRRYLKEIGRMFREYRAQRDSWYVTDNYECFEYALENSAILSDAVNRYREKTERHQ